MKIIGRPKKGSKRDTMNNIMLRPYGDLSHLNRRKSMTICNRHQHNQMCYLQFTHIMFVINIGMTLDTTLDPLAFTLLGMLSTIHTHRHSIEKVWWMSILSIFGIYTTRFLSQKIGFIYCNLWNMSEGGRNSSLPECDSSKTDLYVKFIKQSHSNKMLC